jgi:hypothetical protein
VSSSCSENVEKQERLIAAWQHSSITQASKCICIHVFIIIIIRPTTMLCSFKNNNIYWMPVALSRAGRLLDLFNNVAAYTIHKFLWKSQFNKLKPREIGWQIQNDLFRVWRPWSWLEPIIFRRICFSAGWQFVVYNVDPPGTAEPKGLIIHLFFVIVFV